MNTAEQLSVNLFDKMFGRDLDTRIEALKREFDELIEQYELMKKEPCGLNRFDFMKELADVQSIITHITDIVGGSFESQLIYTNEKLLSRIEVTKYKGKDIETPLI